MLQTYPKWKLKRTDYNKLEPTVESCKCPQLFQWGAKSNLNVYFLTCINTDHMSRNTLPWALLTCLLYLQKYQNQWPEKINFCPESQDLDMFAGVLALERIRAHLSQKCTFKWVWDPFNTLCKSDRASSCAACAQVFTQTRRLKCAVTHAGIGMLQTPENQAKFATGTGICTFGGSENVVG